MQSAQSHARARARVEQASRETHVTCAIWSAAHSAPATGGGHSTPFLSAAELLCDGALCRLFVCLHNEAGTEVCARTRARGQLRQVRRLARVPANRAHNCTPCTLARSVHSCRNKRDRSPLRHDKCTRRLESQARTDAPLLGTEKRCIPSRAETACRVPRKSSHVRASVVARANQTRKHEALALAV